MTTSESTQNYTARHLSILEGIEAVRKRPGMYIGSTDSRGLMHCLWEIIDNSVDEALAGAASEIEVVLYEDGSVEVKDNGRGVPVDEVPGTGLSGVEVVYTKLHAGGKFGGESYASSGGLHGVGASVVNALSARMEVEVDRNGKTYAMSFRRGEPGEFSDQQTELDPAADFVPYTEQSQLRVIAKIPKKRTGTRVRYWADPQIFPSNAKFSLSGLVNRARQTSFLVPGITITIRDLRQDTDRNNPDDLVVLQEVAGETDPYMVRDFAFRHDGGVQDFVEFLAPDVAIHDGLRIQGSGIYSETVQALDKSGHLVPTEVERTCEVDIALRWGQGYENTCKSFVNIIATPFGGTHVAGFEQALLKVVRARVQASARSLKVSAKDPRIEKDDVLAGLTAVITVRVPEPQFEGQTKEVLGTAAVKQIVSKIVEEQLTQFLTSTKRENKADAMLILQKIVGEMRARVSARMHKEISRRKNALESSALPAKLADCRSEDTDSCELFIVEGDSALGTAKNARSSEFQALLPIRGKILNVQKASATDIIKNAEVASIIQVVGAGSGRSFDLEQCRYGKIIMMTDADVDGAHIRTLLLTLFFRYMRPLVEAGRVYTAVPPLHRVEINARGNKPREVVYTYSDDELQRILAKLKKQGRSYKEPIQRYKGLGEMDADQLAETTMDPAVRTLRRISIEDEQALLEANETFELLMGSDVPPRKEFIIAGSVEVDRNRIDA